jgi:hypothetical protein
MQQFINQNSSSYESIFSMRTDGKTDTSKLIVVFCSFEKVLKNGKDMLNEVVLQMTVHSVLLSVFTQHTKIIVYSEE